ncbi:MAG TPA: hypothetical protein PK620_14355 [Denitromonas sp.]|uniref:hypothetical protein n=1 Tax=Denitromonas sp. TaxID=2734609 RepID=UPI001DA70482|nr:hypothetical protein [Rhodocyclaceae bacterium]MCP5222169.1 hypothetical protein [Zoogloeaceae bacterium]HQU89507.1 hypothetical protein [Denitromonas sp.]HQV16098.1 hypothetical protein [Denitromonas sp.]
MSAIPLADNRPPRNTAPASDAHGAEKALEFVADDASNPAFTPRKKISPLPTVLGASGLPTSEAMVSPTDRRRTTTKPEAVPFTHTENGLDDLAFDDPGAEAWFADDENLLDRMRGVREQVSELLDWGLNDKINQAGRELLETLGIDDTTTTRLMIAERTTEDTPPPWAAQAAGQEKTTSENPWDAESGRNAIAKFAFLLWDTLTHPAFIALVLLLIGARALLTLVRLSSRSRARRSRRSRTKSATIVEQARSHGKHWTRRRRIR